METGPEARSRLLRSKVVFLMAGTPSIRGYGPVMEVHAMQSRLPWNIIIKPNFLLLVPDMKHELVRFGVEVVLER